MTNEQPEHWLCTATSGMTIATKASFAQGMPPGTPITERSDHMRTRDTQFNVILSRQEADRLKRNIRRAGLTNSGYIRMLISGYCPKETPPLEYGEIL